MKLSLIVALAAAVLSGLAPSKGYAAPGDLYDTNVLSGNINQITPSGVVSVFVSLGPQNRASDLAFDASDNLYFFNPNNSSIERVKPDGVASVFANLGSANVTGLAFDANGNLYAVVSRTTNVIDIERFTPAGAASVFVATTRLSSPQSLAFDASGNLYVADLGHNTVERFTPGGVESVFASTGLNGPSGLAFDASGNLYVANAFGGYIERFTPGGVGSVFGMNPVIDPYGLAFDASGNLYVASLSGLSNYIERIPPNGGFWSVFASAGGLGTPFGLAFEPMTGPTAVPEPASLAVLAMGIVGLGLTRRKRVQFAPGLA